MLHSRKSLPGLYKSLRETNVDLNRPGEAIHHDRSVIVPVKDAQEHFEGAGYGRVVQFHHPRQLRTLATLIQKTLNLRSLAVATPQSISRNDIADIPITSVGICAGSGGSILNGLDVDLLFTGELSHHEALAATEQGRCVITTFHSNSERAFLSGKMFKALDTQINSEIAEMKKEGYGDESVDGFDIQVSDVDRDPFEVFADNTDDVRW